VSTDIPAREHAATLQFRYPDEPRARVVGEALAPEVGEIDDDRSTATSSATAVASSSTSAPTTSSRSVPGSTAGRGSSRSRRRSPGAPKPTVPRPGPAFGRTPG